MNDVAGGAPTGVPTGVPTAPVLAAHGLVKRYGAAGSAPPALAGVDLTVPRGDSIAVMGPSGSGKSTLLHCLAGILRPDEGTVVVEGERIDTLSEERRSRLRRTVFGFVFQFGQLLPELPVDENVALPLLLGGMPRARAVQEARALLGPLGLAGLEARRPGELSGGQAQRVALARALVIRPSVVFADEPTGSLDQATGHETMRLLVEASRHHGAALVVVTHDPAVARWCARTVEVRDGRITHVHTRPPAPAGPAPAGPVRPGVAAGAR